MVKFLVKRLILSIFVLFGISVLIFCLARIIPGDPARLALGERASDEAVAELREAMHLDAPIYEQYYYWLKDVLKGDFGLSLNTQRDVSLDVQQFLPATLELVIVAGIISIAMAFVFGLLSSKYKDSWIDGTIRVFSYIGISVPAFVWAILFLLFFGYVWDILPVFNRLSAGIPEPNRITGMYILDFCLQGNLRGALDALAHVFLPALALAVGHIFQEARILRSSLIDNMEKEFISVTTGYGIPKRKIMSSYLLKPSAISVTTVAGLDFANTLGNAFLVETIFNWPGISRYCLNAMMTKDLNAISAVVLIIGIIYMIVNIIVDIVIAALDPRVRLGD